MSEVANLDQYIESRLPAELVSFMNTAGELATKRGQKLYLAGGVVRDLLLGKANLDLDLVVEGDAINLAQQLIQVNQAKVTTHSQFGTAKLQWDRWSVDLTTARSESYSRPGALPNVKPGSIDSDLCRRDFTINAMAVHLSPNHYGELIDRHGGRDDLELKFIRVLHEKSFTDDATRIWRSLRYEQRLEFQLEQNTLKLLQRDIPMLDTISGNRIWYELECVFSEESPERSLHRAQELGVLARLHPAIKGDGWLAEKFQQTRQSSLLESPLSDLYLPLLAYRLTEGEVEELVSYLRLPRALTRTLRDTIDLKAILESLANPEQTPSGIYSLLYGYSPEALIANSIACESPVARQHIQRFLDELRYVKPILTGNDLKSMGIPPGPRIKEILNMLQEAKLNGKAASREDEEGLVRGWMVK